MMGLFACLVLVLAIGSGGIIASETKRPARPDAPLARSGYQVLLPWKGDDNTVVVSVTGTDFAMSMKAAVGAICEGHPRCNIKFTSRHVLEEAKGLEGADRTAVIAFSRPIAIWLNDAYTLWDCDTIGSHNPTDDTASCDDDRETIKALSPN